MTRTTKHVLETPPLSTSLWNTPSEITLVFPHLKENVDLKVSQRLSQLGLDQMLKSSYKNTPSDCNILWEAFVTVWRMQFSDDTTHLGLWKVAWWIQLFWLMFFNSAASFTAPPLEARKHGCTEAISCLHAKLLFSQHKTGLFWQAHK